MSSNQVRIVNVLPYEQAHIDQARKDEYRRQKKAALRTLKLLAIDELWRNVDSPEAVSDTASELAKALMLIIDTSWSLEKLATFSAGLDDNDSALPSDKAARDILLMRIRRLEDTDFAWTRLADVYPTIDTRRLAPGVYIVPGGFEEADNRYDARTHVAFQNDRRRLDAEALHEFGLVIRALTIQPVLLGNGDNLNATITYLYALDRPTHAYGRSGQ